MKTASPPARPALRGQIAGTKLRATPQREMVYNILLQRRDHPTADQVFARAKEQMPSISLATVYNCLDALVQSNLVKSVHFERGATQYCPNLRPHAHFHDEATGATFDVDLPQEVIAQLNALLPKGCEPQAVEVTFRGRSPIFSIPSSKSS